MNKVRALVVDDSVVYRNQIRGALSSVPWIEVVGTASNGKIALEMLSSTQVDLMTLDLEMPELTGIETLKKLNTTKNSTKVIVFSSTSPSGAASTLEALKLRAVDFVAKPQMESSVTKDPKGILYDLLVPKIESLFKQSSISLVQPKKSSPFNWQTFIAKAIVIGCSTGGPNALEAIFNGFSGPIPCPIFIVQHMPPVFTASLASRIEKISGIKTAEAQSGELVQANRIYVAPGNFHMEVKQISNEKRIVLNQNEAEHSVRPAVDPLFISAALAYRNNCLGIILTGMGKDGLVGAKSLRAAGNPMVIQDKESCVVFGMPGALYENGEYDEITDLMGVRKAMERVLAKT